MSSFTLLNASAGSGKTQRITLEFLIKILPKPEEAGRVLAITFTNKAAAEMKERIISSLATISKNPIQSKLYHDLKKAFPHWTDAIIAEKASAALSYILHHYSEIGIGTIDSFMQRIIRTFSRDLKLPAAYEISVGDDELNELILNSLIDSANENMVVTTVLKDIIRQQLENNDSPLNIAQILLPLVQHLTTEASADIVAKALSDNAPDLTQAYSLLLEAYKSNNAIITKGAKRIIDIAQELSADGSDPFVSRRHLNLHLWAKTVIENPKDAFPIKKSIQEIIDKERVLVNGPETLNQEIISLFLQMNEAFQRRVTGKMLVKNFPVVALLTHLWRLRESWKSENAILPVSDFNRIIRKVLNEEPVPFIYMRAGSRYRTIMIDEFQDTSLMQWLNLIPLVHESLAGDHSVWVVGDPKQSIYRWRNGQVAIMLRLPQIYVGDSNNNAPDGLQSLINHAFRSEPMSTNYRSARDIVTFNNGFYRFVSSYFKSQVAENQPDNYSEMYHDIEQKHFHQHDGFVSCRFLIGNRTSTLQPLLTNVNNIIQQSIAAGYSFSDIAILTRNNDMGVRISAYLMSLSDPIPVISKETLQFKTSSYCRLVMSVYRLLHRPYDMLNAAETWHLLQQCSVVIFDKNHPLHTFRADKSTPKALISAIHASGEGFPNPEQMQYLPPADQIDLIIQSLHISNKGGFFLLFLREEILKIQNKEGFDAEQIWRWWQKKGLTKSVVVPDGVDAVNVMTIHASKGLQFPVVILPNFNIDDTNNIKNNYFWYEPDTNIWKVPYCILQYRKDHPDRDIQKRFESEKIKIIADSINMMYVATTRAEKHLHLISILKNADADKHDLSAQLLLDFVKSEPSGFNEIAGDEGYMLYEYGKFTKTTKGAKSIKSLFNIHQFSINSDKPLQTLRKTFNRDGVTSRKAAAMGRLMHEILSLINDRTSIETIIQQYYFAGLISEEEKSTFIQLAEEVIRQIPEAFTGSQNVYNERDIARSNGQIARPDRMVCCENNTWQIFDFKTGSVSDEYREQLQNYADAMKESGRNVSKCSLVYINIELATCTIDSFAP